MESTLPNWLEYRSGVNDRAARILEQLETDRSPDNNKQAINRSAEDSRRTFQTTLFEIADHPLINKIKELNADEMTPIQALELIHRWKQEVDNESASASANAEN